MKHAFLFAAIACLIAFAACGDDDEATPTDPPVGVGGVFPRHLTGISPEHQATVTNEDLHVGETDATGGICASFDFRTGETMGEDPTDRATISLGEENVTDSANWVVTDDLPTSMGTMCYAPPEPLDGLQTVIARWSDATDREFVYSWQFTVSD